MRKNVMKVGLLALAVAMVMAACADPNTSSDNENKGATIIRLYMDRVGADLGEGDLITITVGQGIKVDDSYHYDGVTAKPITYPYARAYLSPSIQGLMSEETIALYNGAPRVAPLTGNKLNIYNRAAFGETGYHGKPNGLLDAVANTGVSIDVPFNEQGIVRAGFRLAQSGQIRGGAVSATETAYYPSYGNLEDGGWGFSYGSSRTSSTDEEFAWRPWTIPSPENAYNSVASREEADDYWTAQYYDDGKHWNYRGGPYQNPGNFSGFVLDAETDFEYIAPQIVRDDMRTTRMIQPGKESNYWISNLTKPSASAPVPTTSVIDRSNVDLKVLWSGAIKLTTNKDSFTDSGQVPMGLIQSQVGKPDYVDIMLYEDTQNMGNMLTLFTGNLEGYIELDVVTSNPIITDPHPISPVGPINVADGYSLNQDFVNRNADLNDVNNKRSMLRGMYYYTPKDNKQGFNDPEVYDTVFLQTIYKTDNKRIERVNLKSGINELYLANFSSTQFGDQR